MLLILSAGTGHAAYFLEVAQVLGRGCRSSNERLQKRFEIMDPRTGIKKWSVAIVLCVLFVAAGAAGVWSIHSARSDREASSAARDLQVSAMRVAAADAVRIAGGDALGPGLDAAVDDLAGDHGVALAGLDDVEADRAATLLAEIAGCGSWLLDPGDEVHEVHGHSELQALLDSAATAAADNASAAERTAALSLIVGLLVMLLVAAFAIAARARAHRRQSLFESEQRSGQRLAALVQDSPDLFFVIDPDGLISYRSKSAHRLLGESGVHRDDIASLAEPGSVERLRKHLRRTAAQGALEVFELPDNDGGSRCFELRVSDLTMHRAVGGHVITARDVTDEHRLQTELRHQAGTDTLTGLANRRRLGPALDAAEESMSAIGAMSALVVLDVDGFKGINDAFGNEVGDELLQLVANRLSASCGSVSEILRLGSDEFAAVFDQVQSFSDAKDRAGELSTAFTEPFTIAGRVEQLSASAGMAIAVEPVEVAGLHAKAQLALTAAKGSSQRNVVLYEPEMEESVARKTRIRRALHSAVYDDEFAIAYQPIIATANGELVGLEALLRWNSPTVGVVGPDEFIPIAEASGDICPIGSWVIEQVCRQLSVWTALGMPDDVTVSFNVSARQLAEPDLVDCVSMAARTWRIEPERLVIEVTETAALDETGVAIGRLGELREAGFRISIDDFGSGYSNLGQLLRVPFDVLKIDRSLLLMLSEMRETAGGDPTDPCHIISAIVSIAEILGVPVVCEGVETSEQFDSLAASGVSHVQGYLTGRPAPAAITTTLLGLAATTREAVASGVRQPSRTSNT